MKKSWGALICLVIISLGLVGCFQKMQLADLGKIYGSSAKYEHPDRNPVIVIPGIMGSKLIDSISKEILWGEFGGRGTVGSIPRTAKLLSVPMRKGAALSELNDSTVTAGVLGQYGVRLIPGVNFNTKAYYSILRTLGVGGYRDEQLVEAGLVDYGGSHFTCFQFDYDWRKSCAENAALLAEFIEENREFVYKENMKKFGKSGEVKFNIVAHSMGGLVARYYLRYGGQKISNGSPTLNWEGAKYVDKAIFVGTPNAGSIGALSQITDGLKLSSLLPKIQQAVIGTMPSVYELLPRMRHGCLLDSESKARLDALDLKVWERYGWGVLNPEQDKYLEWLLPEADGREERVEIATEHLKKCLRNARKLHDLLDAPSSPPEHLRMSIYLGDAEETSSTAVALDKTIKVINERAGDGTVTRWSALHNNRVGTGKEHLPLDSPIDWDRIIFLFQNHFSITSDPVFFDNLLFELLKKE